MERGSFGKPCSIVDVLKLVDRLARGASVRKDVRVRIPPSALIHARGQIGEGSRLISEQYAGSSPAGRMWRKLLLVAQVIGWSGL